MEPVSVGTILEKHVSAAAGAYTLEPVSKTYTQRGGFNSQILHVYYANGQRMVEKLVGGKRGGLPFEDAQTVAQDVMQYQQELVGRGVPMPALEKVIVEYNVHDRLALVRMHSVYRGNDVEMILNAHAANEGLHELLEPIVRAMSAILLCACSDRSGWETVVGIDPKASNFTIDAHNRMYYVDPFPPRYRKNGEPIIEWVKPRTELGWQLGYFKHYDVRGIFLGFTAQLARVKPEAKSFIERIAAEELSALLTKAEHGAFLAELAASPWQQVRSYLAHRGSTARSGADAARGQEIIMHAFRSPVCGVPYNVYTLRQIALELAQAKRMHAEALEDFFKNSHFEDEVSQEHLLHLQKELCRFL